MVLELWGVSLQGQGKDVRGDSREVKRNSVCGVFYVSSSTDMPNIKVNSAVTVTGQELRWDRCHIEDAERKKLEGYPVLCLALPIS